MHASGCLCLEFAKIISDNKFCLYLYFSLRNIKPYKDMRTVLKLKRSWLYHVKSCGINISYLKWSNAVFIRVYNDMMCVLYIPVEHYLEDIQPSPSWDGPHEPPWVGLQKQNVVKSNNLRNVVIPETGTKYSHFVRLLNWLW